MTYALVEANTIVNIIKYDGASNYTPPKGLKLVSIPDNVRVEVGWKYTSNTATPPDPVIIVRTKEELKNYSASVRYEKETAGISIANNVIWTDRQTQATITGIVTLMSINPSIVINYKTKTGFIAMDVNTAMTVALAIAGHVQACFDKEKDVSIKIDGSLIQNYDEIDAEYAGF